MLSSQYTHFLGLLLLSSSVAFVFMYFFERLAVKIGLLDIPNQRSSHSLPTPRGAGISFVISSLLTIIAAYYLDLLSIKVFLGLVLGGGVVAAVGFLDDLYTIGSIQRLSVQILVSVFTLWLITDSFSVPFEVRFLPIESATLSIVFGVLFISWMINLYNFMDGVDGIAGTQAIGLGLLAAVLCALAENFQLCFLYILVAVSVVPFQLKNWYPAKVFMGDAGAYYLGFSFAFLSIVGKVVYDQSLVANIVLMGAFICDATATLLIRLIVNKFRITGHRTHGFQKLLIDYNWKPDRISVLYLMVTLCWFFPLSIIATKYFEYGVYICFLSYVPFLFFLLFVRVGLSGAKT